MISGYELNKRW